MSLVQAQWTLDSTADSALSITRGMLRAATSDNIQPLALMACERFGATLAMCPDTCRKIEIMFLPTPQPAVLSFMRGVVGYSAHDCATALGKSLAGVQFLGLAVAMISTMDAFTAASALLELLVDAAADKTLLPTVPHLKALLLSLEARSLRCGFGDEVVGWQTIVLSLLSQTEAEREPFIPRGPPSSGLNHIIGALRQVARIGDTSITKVVFSVGLGSCSWLITFIKWCLGTPPSVYSAGSGVPVLEQPGSPVIIMLKTQRQHSATKAIDIRLEYSIGDPQDLVVPDTSPAWQGLVTIESLGLVLRERYNLDRGSGLVAVRECLPHTVKLVLDNLIYQGDLLSDNPPNLAAMIMESPLMRYRTWPFRNSTTSAAILQRMLGLAEPIELCALANGTSIDSLPAYRAHIDLIKTTCRCKGCTERSDGCTHCDRQDFVRNLSLFTVHVVALSLFHNAEHLKVAAAGITGGEYLNIVWELVRNRPGPRMCCASTLLQAALILVGHGGFVEVKPGGQTDLTSWAMSGAKGQVVYPALYDTRRISQKGYLSLSWHPGDLTLDGVKYSYVRTSGFFSTDSFPPLQTARAMPAVDIDIPRNCWPHAVTEWIASPADESLRLGITLKGVGIDEGRYVRGACSVCTGPANSYVVDACGHAGDSTRTGSSDGFYLYTGIPSTKSKGQSVYGVDGDDDLRFYAACSLGSAVFRLDACLDCCLRVAAQCKPLNLVL